MTHSQRHSLIAFDGQISVVMDSPAAFSMFTISKVYILYTLYVEFADIFDSVLVHFLYQSATRMNANRIANVIGNVDSKPVLIAIWVRPLSASDAFRDILSPEANVTQIVHSLMTRMNSMKKPESPVISGWALVLDL